MLNLGRTTIARVSPEALCYLRSAIAGRSHVPERSTPSYCPRRCYRLTSSTLRIALPTTAILQRRRNVSTSSDSSVSESPLKQPETHYEFFPKTFPSGPPPVGPFSLDVRELRNEFLKLQAKAHPDRHPPERKALAQAISSRINEAYKTLQSPLLRAQYLLSLRGETQHEDDAAKLGEASEDQELLMEVLELRERIEEAEVQRDVDEMKSENEKKVKESVKVLEEAFARDDIEAAKREAVRLRYWVNVEETLHAWEEGKPAPLLQH